MNDNDVVNDVVNGEVNGEVNEFVDIFYVGILPVKVTLAEAEEMISGKPFDGCRMVDVYEPYDKCFMLGMLNSTYANGLYNSVILPALVKLFPEGGSVCTREISADNLVKIKEEGTYFERMVIFNWLTAYANEVGDHTIGLSAVNWLLTDDKLSGQLPAFNSSYH